MPSEPPTAKIKPATEIGPGEGQLNLIAREGYVDDRWAKPFMQETSCQIKVQYAGSSAEMVNLMKNGGDSQWDLVSATGDIGLGLIYGGDVKPVNPGLISDWKNFQPVFQSPAFNTVRGIHYGISLGWSPNLLLFNTNKYRSPPTSWDVIYDSSNKGLITVPDNPIQIADAALYLSTKQPQLGIKDPYELTATQFEAALNQLKDQHMLVKQYWAIPSEEVALFQTGAVFVGSGWPYQSTALKALGAPVNDVIPAEGVSAWADSWMLATKAQHPNCAYLWVRYVSAAKIQAEQALLFGESPVNTRACAEMEAQQAGSCAQFHANALPTYFDPIRFWRTPLATCGNGSQSCVPYDQWVSAWAAIKAG